MESKSKNVPHLCSHTQKAVSKELIKAIYLEVSKYVLDLSKLIFGGVILTIIIDADLNRLFTFVGGCMAVAILITIGLILYKKGKEQL